MGGSVRGRRGQGRAGIAPYGAPVATDAASRLWRVGVGRIEMRVRSLQNRFHARYTGGLRHQFDRDRLRFQNSRLRSVARNPRWPLSRTRLEGDRRDTDRQAETA